MIRPQEYAGKTVGVFGLARSGRAAVEALAEVGANILAWDDDASRRDDLDVNLVDLYETDLSALDALLLAPGVPLTHPAPHPLAARASAAGTPIIGDIELFAAARPGLPSHRVIGITGTNGKSTTAALMAHTLRQGGYEAALGGNIGVPVLGLEPLSEGGIYVLELSSFQLELTHSLDCELAILLNITPDHLDRHGDFEGYVAAKRRLFETQSEGHVAIIGVDDAPGREIAGMLPQQVIRISMRESVAGGIFVDPTGKMYDGRAGKPFAVGDLAGNPRLAGRHNWQNAAAVYAAVCCLGLEPPDVFEAFASFPGLAHRCELVAERDGVLFVNDSKATNFEAAATALAAFDRIRWIAGGRAKSTDTSMLVPYLEHVRAAYLIGEAAPALAKALAGRVTTKICHSIEAAVEAAAAEAQSGDAVLLSPGCASFDQFSDFEARGEAFRAAVHGLAKGDDR